MVGASTVTVQQGGTRHRRHCAAFPAAGERVYKPAA